MICYETSMMDNEIEHNEKVQPENEKQGDDKSIECQQCGEHFIFSEREQKFFGEMGFVAPRYCPSCRKIRKQDLRKNSEWKETYEVSCDKCGQQTTVPFKPVNGRPVYCRECLSEIRSESGDDQNYGGSGKSNVGSRFSEKIEDKVVGVGITRIDDNERPYEQLDRNVERLMEQLLGNNTD